MSRPAAINWPEVAAACDRVQTARAYIREHFPRGNSGYVGHMRADDYDRDVDTLAAAMRQLLDVGMSRIDGSTP